MKNDIIKPRYKINDIVAFAGEPNVPYKVTHVIRDHDYEGEILYDLIRLSTKETNMFPEDEDTLIPYDGTIGGKLLRKKIAELELKRAQLDHSVDLLEATVKTQELTPTEELLIEQQIKQERKLKETIQKRIEVNLNAQ